MTTTTVTTIQTAPAHVIKPNGPGPRNNAARVTAVALAAISSAIILSTVPVPASVILVTGIGIATLIYTCGPFDPSDVISEGENIDLATVRRRTVYIREPVRTVYVKEKPVPVFFPTPTDRPLREIASPPEPSEHRPVGNREPRIRYEKDSEDSSYQPIRYESPRREHYTTSPFAKPDGEVPHRTVGSRA